MSPNRRTVVLPVAALAAALLAGCMHAQETVTVAPSGVSSVTVTMTMNPAIVAGMGGKNPFTSLAQYKKHPLPGQVTVSPYTDRSGWKGAKLMLHETSPTELDKLETSATSGASPMFSSFSIKHKGPNWSIYAKFNKAAFSTGSSGSTNKLSLQSLRATGFSYIVSFSLPGRVLFDNANSHGPKGLLSWDLLDQPSTLQARWLVP